MRMCKFRAKNGPFPQMRILLENQLTCLVSFIHAYLHAKNQSQILIYWWNIDWKLIGREPFLSITWEPNFSQACSFRRMLMNYKNFHLTQIPDKTNHAIFLKSPKTMFLAHFWPFFVIFAQWGFFPCHTQLYMGP